MNAFIADDPFDNESIIKKKFWSHVKSINKTARIPETVFYKDKFCHNPKDNCELFNNYFADQFSEKVLIMLILILKMTVIFVIILVK